MCQYCSDNINEREPLFVRNIDLGVLGKYEASDIIVMSHERKRAHIEFSIVDDDGNSIDSLYDIKFCPVCGRNLLESLTEE